MAATPNRESHIVELDNPGLYIERLLEMEEEIVPRAAEKFLEGGAHIPDHLAPLGEYLANRAATAYGHPYGDKKSEQAAAYRGIDFGHILLSCCNVEGSIKFETGPLVTRLKPNELFDRIVMNSSKLLEKSALIDRVTRQSVGVVDPLEEEPELAQYGMLMAFHLAGYGEMCKHQLYFGETQLLVAKFVVGRELGRYADEAMQQGSSDPGTFDDIMDIPDAPEPGVDLES